MNYAPRPYQHECLAAIRGQFACVDSTLAVMATGLGKAQPLNAKILTPNGFVEMRDIEVGDEVIGSDGKPVTVTGCFPQGIKEVFDVHFSDGTKTHCCDDHLWSVQTKSQKYRGAGFQTLELKSFRRELCDGSGAAKWFVPVVSPVEFNWQDTPLDPYVLGVLLGDGCTRHRRVILSSADAELLQTIGRLVPAGVRLKHLKNYDYLVTEGNNGRRGSQIGKALRILGLAECMAHEKFIPDCFKYNIVNTRLEILRGLMDTDGHVRPKDGHVEFSSTSRRLADDVCEIVRSFGGCARVRTKSPGRFWYNGQSRTGRESYRVTITLDGINPFRLSRKRDLYRNGKNQGQTKAIVGVFHGPYQECKCISVDSKDSLYVTDDYILTHNTVTFATLADEWREGGVMMLAHRDELLSQGSEKFEAITHHKPWVEKAERTVSDGDGMFSQSRVLVTSVQTMGQKCGKRRQRVIDWAGHKFGGIRLIIVDEAHRCAPGTQYDRIISDFRKASPMPVKVLGVTATPRRTDEKSLGSIFDSCAYNYGISEAVRDAWLVPIRQKSVFVKELDFSKLKSRRNPQTGEMDFSENELNAILVEEKAMQEIAGALVELSGDRRGLVFCSGVEHARSLCSVMQRPKYFGEAAVAYLHGGTPEMARKQIIADYNAGRVRFICNCGVLTEGFDAPATSLIVMARPTKSLLLYTQIVGRGTRPLPGLVDVFADVADRRRAIAESIKPDCLVLDFVGNAGRHKLVTCVDVLGGDKMTDEQRQLALAACESSDVSNAIAASEVEMRFDGEMKQVRFKRQQLERQLIEEANVWRQRHKRIHVAADAVRLDAKDVDPFDQSDTGDYRNAPPKLVERPFKWQIDLLCANGWEPEHAEKLSRGAAFGMCAKIKRRLRDSDRGMFQ